MEDQIDSLKRLRQDALATSIKLKKTIISQTDELINLLKERQHELVFNVDEICLQQMLLFQDLLHKFQCSQTEDIDVSKYLITDQISNLSRGICVNAAEFEELKSAIKSFGKISKGPQLEKRTSMNSPIFDLEKSIETEVFAPSKQCSVSSNCSGESKTSLDSFEVIETIEPSAEDHALQKHEKLDDLACKKPLMNAMDIPDMKYPLKIKMIADWLHKNDAVDEECSIVTKILNDQKPLNKASNITIPLQLINSTESVSHTTKSVEEHCVNPVTSNSRTIHDNSLLIFPKKATLAESQTYSTENDSCESLIRHDFKEWLNDSKFTVRSIISDHFIPTVRDDLKKWLNKADPKEVEKQINIALCSVSSSPAKVVEQSFSPYFVKDDHKEWLCSRKCV